MAKIAILGFGTVGSGVLEVIRRNAAGIGRRAGEPVEVKYILDIRDFSGHPDAALFVNNIDVILSDPEVRVVVETIGGVRFAYPYVKAALESGRSVCTSNKELVATHGAELLAIARSHGAAFLFEASVGGGTPHYHPHAPVPGSQRDYPGAGDCERYHQLYAYQDGPRRHGFCRGPQAGPAAGLRRDPGIRATMWTAPMPAARSAFCQVWRSAIIFIHRTCPPAASGM